MPKPIVGANLASATPTGEAPRIKRRGLGKTGSTNTSIVPWLGQEFLAKIDAAALLAGRRAEFGKRVFGRDQDESRLAVQHTLARCLDDRGARASAADPAFLYRAVRPDQSFGARLRGGDGDGANDGGECERLAPGLTQCRLLEDAHYILSR
jgi:hypothetical protein